MKFSSKDLNLPKPNFFLDAAGENASQTIGQILIKIDVIIKKTETRSFSGTWRYK